MLFPTFDFLLFFIVTVAVMTPVQHLHQARKLVLLVASYVFYARWNPSFCLLLAFSSMVTYASGWLIASAPGTARARWVLGATIALHLSVLGAYKYADLLIGTANQGLAALGTGRELPFLGLILPVGISFYTFHGISYIVDVYRGDVAVCRRLSDMLLYLSFFPQLVAGPIVRASFFLPQLYAPAPSRLPIQPALALILGGMFKKVIIANYLATELVDPVFFDPANFSSLDLLLAMYGYAVQIYCDFSGYTDMAIGLAQLLGYQFPINFNQPYRATSFRDFWRRWHISLSSWLRDYLYKPLGGSRHGSVRTAFALMATMLLGGLWHGANWRFVLWGALHGGALAIERQVLRIVPRRWQESGLAKAAAVLIVFHVVCISWILFRSDSLEAALIYLQGLGQFTGGVEQARPLTVGLIVLGLSLHFLPPEWNLGRMRPRLALPAWALGAVASLVIVAIDAMGPDGVAPFIYFQF
jgi:D-alanyl-lipoteichoic acid acyltransferase DltB (MBOAT superfamily)